jgi:hypothetical protein
MPCCAGAIAAQQARIGAEKRHQDEHGGGWKVVKDGAAPAPAEEEEPFEETRKKGPKAILLRICNGILDFLNSTALQTTAYLIFVLVFQTLTESMRKKEEYYFDRVRPRPPRRRAAAAAPPRRPADPPAARPSQMITDKFIENHFDSSHNTFESVRRVADIWEWGNNVLWSGYFSDAGPCDGYVGAPVGHPQFKTCMDDVWPDGEGSFHMDNPTAYTAEELAYEMDKMDWTEGVLIRTARVGASTDEACRTQTLVECMPEMTANERSNNASFGYNWTHPSEKLYHEWEYFTPEQLGAVPDGVGSAAIPSMRTFEAGGFPAIIIPFFSEDWLDPEEGTAAQARSTPPPPRLPPRRASPLFPAPAPAAPT